MNKLQKIHKTIVICLCGVILFSVISCKGDRKYTAITTYDDLTSGTIHISADESFKPIIDSQIKVFMSLYPKAVIIPHYKSEADCIKDLLVDSIRLVIITRGLSEQEVNSLKDTLGFKPPFGRIASDAIAVIVNNKAKDSLFTMSDIRSFMKGISGFKLTPVLDGKTATSTIRFMVDSVLKGEPLAANIAGADSSMGVVDYVSKNENAIGFVGVSWVGNPDDKDQIAFLSKIRVASIEARSEPDKFIKPYQANIVTKRYPMVRGLYYILKENFSGLGRGFTNFLEGEKGQLIFQRAYLVPSKMDYSFRETQISEE